MTTEERRRRAEEILDRGIITGILPDRESFIERLVSDTPMKLYIGADPTSTSLHLSHAKNYLLLEEFRQLGHEVIVLFGDFTAKIGDPTDRLSARKQLTTEEVEENVSQWIEQIRPLMDFDASENPPRVLYNSQWLSPLTMEEVIKITSHVTVQRMLERDMFQKRIADNQPIHMHEFLYPLMQGYDSVAMEVDAELCGTDQTFNALVGRTLSKQYLSKEKFVVTVNLMENPKTGELMSKSRGTGVFLNATPFDMYGAIMSQPDEMTELFFINNTRLPLQEIKTILSTANPRDAKMRAAYEVTKIFHGEATGKEAEDQFIRLVQHKEVSADVPEVTVQSIDYTLYSLLREVLRDDEFSNSEIRRLIEQGSIKVGGEKVDVADAKITLAPDGIQVKIGKKRWLKVIPKT